MKGTSLRVALAKLKEIENIYNLMVQIDFLAGLCVATVLGLCLGKIVGWYMFVILLVVSLILGIITVKVYVKMIKGMIKEK